MRSLVIRLKKILLAMLIWQAGISVSWALDVHVVAETDAAAQYFTALIKKDLPQGYSVQSLNVQTKSLSAPDIYVALSPKAYQSVATNNTPTIVLSPGTKTLRVRESDRVINWAASLAQQLQLAHTLFPALKRVGILGGEDISQYRQLNRYAREHGIELMWQSASGEAISRQASDLISRNDLLIAPYDPDVYNRDTIKSILLSTYRQGKVLIGQNATYVNAGALASVYYSSEAIANRVASHIRHFAKHEQFAPSQPLKPEVVINHQVAKSLGIKLIDEKDLIDHLDVVEIKQ